MAALPYMPFYVADYLADTAHLSASEHGAYMLLLMTHWQSRKPLPNDNIKLARITRSTVAEWEAVRPQIEAAFTIDETGWHSPIWGTPKGKKEGWLWRGRPQWERGTQFLRRKVINRDGNKCVYCGADDRPLEVDHFVPVVRGGGGGMDNLVTACRPCNRSKGAKTIQDWLGVEA